MQLNPTSLAATRNLAVLFMRAGLVDRAIEQFRKALAMNPPESEAATLHSNLVATMFHQWPYAPPAHFEEHVRWAQRFADPLTAAAAPHESDGSPDRRLRIGYVSPDFRMHPVASFFEPILKHHDRQNFEVYCYANVAKTDEVTERFRASTDVWRDVAAMSDEQAAKQMREDRIDILVDLAGHTAGHRLLVFARKPAPVQVSYLGYMATTGMSAIDYRITDAYLDLPGKTERFHTEQLVRLLPKCYCYEPPSGPAELAIEPPKRANGFITFASSNRLVKVNSDVMTAWARITQGVEHSRLVLLAPGSRDAAERCLAHLEQHGVARQRVELLPSLPYRKYLQTLAQFDIGLDAFPVSGHTTTCNTLWMGTPVVTLAGETYVSRLGASVLANLGLHNLIASNVDEYVRIAIDLAHDEARLAQLRRDLRGLVEDRVADGLTFTRQLEGAYRMMWRRWCA
ncbi:tetratricopeptide repeat protein [soil metagenome]